MSGGESFEAEQTLEAIRKGLADALVVYHPEGEAVYTLERARQTAERAAQQARQSEERLQAIIELAMDAIVSVDEQQRIVLFNRAAEQMFRCPAADAIGGPLDRFIPPRVREAHRRHVEEFGRHGVTARTMGALGELTGLRADGEEFPIEASISQTEADGRKLFTVILRDITERRRAEDALRRALADKDALLREVHHRTKNNLQMLCDLLYLQGSAVESPEAREGLHEASGRVVAIARLHEELYQSLDSGHVRLGEYLGRLVAGVRAAYGRDGIAFRVAAEGVSLDLDRAVTVGLIVNELVTNALKYAFPGERTGEIAAEALKDGGHYVVRVSDTGVGLPPGFDLAQASNLGLRLVRTFAARLQGAVTVDPGQGAAFRVSFPIHAPE
jgi:PAS domain S-box-containing protein